MKAFYNNRECEIWKIPSQSEIKRYSGIQHPPSWLIDAEKRGFVKVSNSPDRWSYVSVKESSGSTTTIAIAGDWIVKFGDYEYSVYGNKIVEKNFRTPFGDDF